MKLAIRLALGWGIAVLLSAILWLVVVVVYTIVWLKQHLWKGGDRSEEKEKGRQEGQAILGH